MEKKRSDHYMLGYTHREWGLPRYKFQDPFLQAEYDKGFDNFDGVDSDSDSVENALKGGKLPAFSKTRKDKW